MKRNNLLLLLFCFLAVLLISGVSAKTVTKKKLPTKPNKPDPVTVVEQNRFYSNVEKFTNYNVSGVEKGKPLITTISPDPQSKNTSYNNTITITLSNLEGSKTESKCVFKSFDDVCILEKVDSDPVNMKLQCSKLPCQVRFTNSQTDEIANLNSEEASQLYRIDEIGKHVMVTMLCNDPEIKDYKEKIHIYSTEPYTRYERASAVEAFFKTSQKGYMYIKTESAVLDCLTLEVTKSSSEFKDEETINDYLTKNQANTYGLTENVPKGKKLRLEYTIHSRDATKKLQDSVLVELLGTKNGTETSGEKFYIQSMDANDGLIAGNIIFTKDIDTFQKIRIKLSTNSSEPLILSLNIVKQDVQDVETDDINYFSLKSGQELKFKLVPDTDNDEERVEVTLSNSNQGIEFSPKICQVKQGCDITLKATKDVSQAMLILKPTTESTDKHILINSTATHKIRQLEKLYFIHKVEKKHAIQITVNSENVIVYVGKKECPYPNETCYNYSGNYNNFIEVEDYEGDLYITVEGLDHTIFTLRVIDSVDFYIDLKDGEPFTYNMRDSDKIGFEFKKPQGLNSSIDLNLIAPLNTLMMLVAIGTEQPTSDSADYVSKEGAVTIPLKAWKKSESLVIVVQKTNNYTHNVHFTLIVSSKKTVIPLESSRAHYETLSPGIAKYYLIGYNANESNYLQISSYSDLNQKINLTIRGAKSLKQIPDKKNTQLDAARQYVDLNLLENKTCKGNEFCELYVFLQNNMNQKLDVMITLIVKDGIIELQDGIWQSYTLNAAVSSNHFYFMPKHKEKSINLNFKSSFRPISIKYKMWKMVEGTQLNPSKWPFPKEESTDSRDKNDTKLVSAPYLYEPLRQISVTPDNLAKCWPECVLLVSMTGLTQINNATTWDIQREDDFFDIMATNDILEISPDEKVDLTLQEKEQKTILIDLRNYLNKTTITFFTHTIIGDYGVYGVVTSNKKTRVASVSESDFMFAVSETQLNIATVMDRLKENEMEEDEQKYIALTIIATTASKLTFEYTYKQDRIKILEIDTFETVKMEAGEERMYQIVPSNDFTINVIRVKGMPFMQYSSCSTDGLEQCIDSMSNLEQLTSKTTSFTGKFNQKAVSALKVQAKQYLEFVLYIKSTYGEVSLREGTTITDFADKNAFNKYSLTTLRGQETVLTVNVFEGDPEVTVAGTQVNFKRKKKDGIIHISIPPIQSRPNKTQRPTTTNMYVEGLDLFGSFFGFDNPFAYNGDIEMLHVTVVDNSSNTYYTIGYTSAERELELDDGLVTTILIDPKSKASFVYEPLVPVTTDLFVTISFKTAQELKSANIKISMSNQEGDTDEFTPTLPEFKKKTPHPTTFLKLSPGYSVYYIHIESTGKVISPSIVVNHNQLLVLPYDVQYPIYLKETEEQYLVTQVQNMGYLLVTIKKCNQGSPILSYGFNQQEMKSDEWQNQYRLDSLEKASIKIKAQIGTFYMKLNVDTPTSLAISVHHYPDSKSVPTDSIKAGNQGIVDYQLINSIEAEISFAGISCGKSPCPKVTYSYLSSTSLENLYNQLSCPNTYFDYISNNTALAAKSITTASGNQDNNTIKFEYRLPDQISFLGVRADLPDGRYYIYSPIEVVTIWGHISRNKKYHNFFLMLGCALVLLCLCMAMRRRHRKGYGVLRDEE